MYDERLHKRHEGDGGARLKVNSKLVQKVMRYCLLVVVQQDGQNLHAPLVQMCWHRDT